MTLYEVGIVRAKKYCNVNKYVNGDSVPSR